MVKSPKLEPSPSVVRDTFSRSLRTVLGEESLLFNVDLVRLETGEESNLEVELQDSTVKPKGKSYWKRIKCCRDRIVKAR